MEDLLPGWAHETFALQYARVNGHRVPYLAGGRGDPVVMVHGLTGSLDWWQYNAPVLAGDFSVYLIDLPGFGRLGHLRSCESMPEYVNWVCAWMDAVGLRRSIFIGHSMGGHICVRLAASQPERVERLVLVAPAGVLPARRLPHYLPPVLKTIRQVPAALLPQMFRDLHRSSLAAAWRSGHDLIERNALDLIESVSVPTLLIWGAEDPIIPAALADLFIERIPDAELLLLPDTGHMPMVEEPDQFNRAVRAFLSGQ